MTILASACFYSFMYFCCEQTFQMAINQTSLFLYKSSSCLVMPKSIHANGQVYLQYTELGAREREKEGGREREGGDGGAPAVKLQTLSDLCFFNQRGEFDLGAVSKQSTLLPCIAKLTGVRAGTAFLSQAGGHIFQQRRCSHVQSKSPNSFICHMDGQFSRGLLLLSHRSP